MSRLLLAILLAVPLAAVASPGVVANEKLAFWGRQREVLRREFR